MWWVQCWLFACPRKHHCIFSCLHLTACSCPVCSKNLACSHCYLTAGEQLSFPALTKRNATQVSLLRWTTNTLLIWIQQTTPSIYFGGVSAFWLWESPEGCSIPKGWGCVVCRAPITWLPPVLFLLFFQEFKVALKPNTLDSTCSLFPRIGIFLPCFKEQDAEVRGKMWLFGSVLYSWSGLEDKLLGRGRLLVIFFLPLVFSNLLPHLYLFTLICRTLCWALEQ